MNKERFLSFDSKRKIFILLFVLNYLITEFGREVYRPFIYRSDIFDYWIADTIGNFTGTATIVFFELAFINPTYRNGRNLLFIITFGLIGYEAVQYILPGSTFDYRDVIATIFGGLLSLLIYNQIFKKFPESQKRD